MVPETQARSAHRPPAHRTRRTIRPGLARPGQPWDSHDDMKSTTAASPSSAIRAIAALVARSEKARAFESTLVIWGGEFGRTPTVELPRRGRTSGKINGRDHNHWGFTCGSPAGASRVVTPTAQQTSSVSRPSRIKVHVHDLHATLLKLLGFDHEKFTYRYAGRDFRLTDVHGHVVKEVLA